MAVTKRILGQTAPGTSQASLYTVPSGKMTTTSSFVACNRGSALCRIRLSVAPVGAADGPTQYLFYDVGVEANDTFVATIGLTLAAADVVRIQTDVATMTFSLFGAEEDV